MYIAITKKLWSPIFAALLLGLCSVSVLAQSAPQDTRLGSGDLLRVTVFGQADLETTARITRAGNITFPLIGEVRVEGLTSREAEAEIEQGLLQGQFVRNPQVTIFVEDRIRQASEVVTIIGQVKKPGRFAVDASSNDGAQDIVGLIALAGGVSDDAGDYLVLSKNGDNNGKKIRVDLVGLMRNGNLNENHPLSGGDIVLVPSMDVIYVYGEVEKPGRYRLDRGMTVMQAISVGGGLTSVGTEKGLSISRRGADGETTSVKSGLNDQLQPNDVVLVRESLF